MQETIICLTAFLGSALTLFSGFGLGTLLLPVFALFFPIEISILLTAIVHFLNNIFKLTLFGKHANKSIIIRFGIPSIIAAFVGAYILNLLTDLSSIYEYTLINHLFSITPIKLIIGFILLFFALVDIIPSFKKIEFDKKYLPVGGLLSGFFGGLSGIQGALRTAFLIRANLTKEEFIATGIVIACLVDITRMIVYGQQIINSHTGFDYLLLILATFSAFAGAYLGNSLLKKVTIKTIQFIVGGMLLIFSLLLMAGIL